MLDRRFLYQIFIILIYILLQGILFNHIGFLGYLNPLVYLIFLVHYPYFSYQNYPFLFLAFLLGLGIDQFEGTGGIYAFSCAYTAFLRSRFVLLFVNRKVFDIESFNLSKFNSLQMVGFVSVLMISHAAILFFMGDLTIENPVTFLKKILFTFLITAVFVIFYHRLILSNRLIEK